MAARRMAAALPSLPPARMAARRTPAALSCLLLARMAARAFLKAKGGWPQKGKNLKPARMSQLYAARL